MFFSHANRYWQFIIYLFLGLLVCEILLSSMPSVYLPYSVMIGYIGLSVEATLPLPQLLTHFQTKSVKGFRLTILVSWLGGDALKMLWFFTTTTEIPWAFKICAMFQATCDCLLALQFLMYGDVEREIKELLWSLGLLPSSFQPSYSGVRTPSRSLTPSRWPVPALEVEKFSP